MTSKFPKNAKGMCKKYTKTFCSSIFDSFLPGGSAFLPNVSTQKKIFETFSCFLSSVSVFLSSLVVFGRLVVWGRTSNCLKEKK